MVGRLQRSLVLLAATLASATPEVDKDCETKTVRTTIPYLGPTTRCTTLPVCDGTETIVVETPFPTCCHTTAKWPPTHTTTTVKPTTKKETTTTAKPTTTKKPTTTMKPTTTKKPTTMTTKTSTSTSTSSTPTAPSGACLNIKPLCSADGFDAAYYANELGGYSNPYTAVYSNYYIVDGLTPLASSLTSVTFFEQNTQPASGGIYPNSSLEVGPFSYTQFPYFPGWTRDTNGGIVVDANNFTMVYSGYFKAPSTGTWQLCASADNENDIYFGDGNAFACLDGSVSTADDPLAMCSGGYFNNAPVCATVDLVEGFFYPIRSVMANWQGPSAFNLTMVAPGVDTTKGSNDFTGYAYPNSCGLFATAPAAP